MPDRRVQVAALQRAADDVARDLARVLERAASETTRSCDLQARAIDAVRHGDERAARDALRAVETSAELLRQLDADATVLRAMLAECRIVLDDTEGGT